MFRSNCLIIVLWWGFSFAISLGMVGACSPQQYKAQADKEVYNIIDSKWQPSFGTKVNYTISDVPPSPNDIQIDENEPPRVISLAEAVAIATANNRQYQTQKEQLYLAALDLTGERYKYALRWFGTIDGSYIDNKRNGEDFSLQGSEGVNTTELLLNGAIVNASLMIDWLRFLTGDPRTTLGAVLSGDLAIPLLGSGAGKVARESLTQAERNVLYQIRSFNRYRKTFVVSIVNDYYNVLQRRDEVLNAKSNYDMQVESKRRLDMYAEAGRVARIQVDEAEQSMLRAENNWVVAQQRYEQALDQFKIRLALPADAQIQLDPNELDALRNMGISEPNYPLNAAVVTALTHRLDLANSGDRIDDAARNVKLAAEGLDVQLNLVGSAEVGSAGNTRFIRLQFQRGTYRMGWEADLPCDRKIERNNYRRALITLTQQQREYENDVDQVKLQVRNAYRQLREQAESYRIQKLSLDLAKARVESNRLLLDAGRIEVRLLLDSQNALLRAQNDFTAALVAHTIAKLNFFRDIGVLQVRPDGMWEEPR